MKDSELFIKYAKDRSGAKYSDEVLNELRFYEVLKERDKYRVCKNCISCFSNSGYYSCLLNDVFLFTEKELDKFSCVDFESK